MESRILLTVRKSEYVNQETVDKPIKGELKSNLNSPLYPSFSWNNQSDLSRP